MKTRSYAFQSNAGGGSSAANMERRGRQDPDSNQKRDAAGETLPERRLRQKTEGAAAMAEHIARNHAIDERTERLRALRLAREQAEQAEAAQTDKAEKAPKTAKKKIRRAVTQRSA